MPVVGLFELVNCSKAASFAWNLLTSSICGRKLRLNLVRGVGRVAYLPLPFERQQR
jgi:hypothetical protein